MEKLPATPDTFKQLLKLEKIEPHHVATLSAKDKNELLVLISDTLKQMKGERRDAFIEKTSLLIDPELLWEYNHAKISVEIAKYVDQYGAMPNASMLATETGLSRKTIDKHLKALLINPSHTQLTAELSMMNAKVMAVVLRAAMRGDMKAAKIYLDTNKGLMPAPSVVNHQNNFIQVNKTVINQQLIQQLRPEQLLQIEEIITNSDENTNKTS